ncbi:hemagglutinin/amebocyte aggregation factor-like [Labeo rohita]|uniref:hemagglutinin/amebocyte aggregation factor-like n=1 Tax=Labeo rohita TaxID=84645 RepID=UPI0021E22463|nr:hemagglutinin/amebocyte aggregation factor-like [Labeo rohita]
MMRRVAIFLLLNGLLAIGQGWHNNFDEPLSFKCLAGQSISSIRSEHSNYHEDRHWDLSCKRTNKPNAECHQSAYVNDFDKAFTFECPENYAIAGMSSYHSNYHEDRRWQFYCCKVVCASGDRACQWTTYVNTFDEYFHWNVPPHSVLVGAESYHQNYQEDRRWRYKYCVKPCL